MGSSESALGAGERPDTKGGPFTFTGLWSYVCARACSLVRGGPHVHVIAARTLVQVLGVYAQARDELALIYSVRSSSASGYRSAKGQALIAELDQKIEQVGRALSLVPS